MSDFGILGKYLKKKKTKEELEEEGRLGFLEKYLSNKTATEQLNEDIIKGPKSVSVNAPIERNPLFKKEDKYAKLGASSKPTVPQRARFTDIVNVLSVPHDAIVEFADTIATEGLSGFGKALGNAYKEAKSGVKESVLNEYEALFGDPTKYQQQSVIDALIAEGKPELAAKMTAIQAKRPTVKDLLNKHSPEFVQEYPVASTLLSLAGDIAIDPLTYVSFGESTIPKYAGKLISNKGIKSLRELNALAKEGSFIGLVDIGKGVTKEIPMTPLQYKAIKQIGQEFGDAKALETMSNFFEQSGGGKFIGTRPMKNADRVSSVTKDFLELSKTEPLTLETGPRVRIKIPFGNGYDVVSPKAFKAVSELVDKSGIGNVISNARELLAESRPIQMFKKGFSRNGQIEDLGLQGQAYLHARNEAFGELNRIDYITKKATTDLFSIPVEEREKLRSLAGKIDDEIAKAKDEYVGVLTDHYTPRTAADYSGEYQVVNPIIPQKTLQENKALLRQIQFKPGTILHGTSEDMLGKIIGEGIQPSQLSGTVDAEIVGKTGYSNGLSVAYAGQRGNGKPILIGLRPTVERISSEGGPNAVAAFSKGKSYIHPNDIEFVQFPDGAKLDLYSALDKIHTEQVLQNQHILNEVGKNIDVSVGNVGGTYILNPKGKSSVSVNSLEEIPATLESLGYQKVGGYKAPQNYIDNLTLPQHEVTRLRTEALNKALSKGEINSEQFSIMSRYFGAADKAATIEAEAKMLRQSVENANPDIYLLSRQDDKAVFYSAKGKAPKSFDSLDKAIAEGYAPELDVAIDFAVKLRTALTKRQKALFDDAVTTIFGKDIPDVIKQDIAFINNPLYSKNLSDSAKYGLRLLDKATNAWKFLATAKPSFGVRQQIGNTLLSYAGIGGKALKAFDPRTFIDTLFLMSDNSAYAKMIPQKLVDVYRKYGMSKTGQVVSAINKFEPQLVEGIKYKTLLGEDISGRQMFDELIDNSIVRKGQTALDPDTAKDLRLEIAKDIGWKEFQKSKAHQGLVTFAKESLPWVNLPGHVEDLSKAQLYVQLRQMGMDAKNATRETNRILVDYLNGLSKFERQVMRRVVPFYTFNRFAIPLIASLVKHPGRAANLQKTTKAFFEVWNKVAGGETLTNDEREVLPGYLIEQPSTFESFQDTQAGQRKAVFRTFNNFSFTDIMSMMVTDSKGNIDLEKTTQKMALANLTPFLKIPLETAIDHNFFTGRVISKGGKIVSGELPETVENNTPEWIRNLIQYEVRVNPATGEKIGYVNPYMTHIMAGFVPALNDYISLGRDDLSAIDFGMKYLGGVGKVGLNLQEEKRWRIKELQDTELKQLQTEFRRAIFSGNKKHADELQQRLQDTMLEIARRANLQVRE